MTGPAYLDFKGAVDLLAPPEAQIAQPIPVAIVADLSTFSAEILEPRAIIVARGNRAGAIFMLQPVGGAGLIVEAFSFIVGGGVPWGFGLTPGRIAGPPDAADIQQLEIGGPDTRFIALSVSGSAGLFPMTVIVDEPGELSLTQRIFVPAGGSFFCGADLDATVRTYVYQLTVREVTTSPKGLS